MWNPVINKLLPDCLYYCIAQSLGTNPSCLQTAVLTDPNGTQICHQHGVGAVHSVVVGNTDPIDSSKFDLLLVFTGGAQFVGGESSMRKLSVQVTDSGASRRLHVLKSVPFAEDLFVDVPPAGEDIGGDHAWVDSTGDWVWISTFRAAKPGVHLVEYATGKLVHSVTGMSDFLPNNFAYPAGIHGVGTLGVPGSYLAVATSACTNVKLCAPIPWHNGKGAQGIMFIVDLNSMAINITV